MYKKQLRFQKLACLFSMITAAIYFIYSLGIITDIHDSLKSTIRSNKEYVSGASIYYDMQGFNALFVKLSVVLILLACLLYLMNTQVRRKYYIGNYVAIGLYSVAALGVTIWSHIQISAFKNQFLTTVDFEALKEYAEDWGTLYTESTFWLDLHYLVGVLSILAVILLVGNMVWKIRLMRAEDALIEAGKEVAV